MILKKIKNFRTYYPLMKDKNLSVTHESLYDLITKDDPKKIKKFRT